MLSVTPHALKYREGKVAAGGFEPPKHEAINLDVLATAPHGLEKVGTQYEAQYMQLLFEIMWTLKTP